MDETNTGAVAPAVDTPVVDVPETTDTPAEAVSTTA